MTLSRWLDRHPHLVTFLALVGLVTMNELSIRTVEIRGRHYPLSDFDFTPERVQTLWEIAILAFYVLEEQGNGKANDQLSPSLAYLDSFMANEIDDEMWDELSDYVERKRPKLT